MISLNHSLKLKSIGYLHAYKRAANPRKPTQILTFSPHLSRKFGLKQVAVGLNRRLVDAVVDRVAALTERGYNRMRLLKSNPL